MSVLPCTVGSVTLFHTRAHPHTHKQLKAKDMEIAELNSAIEKFKSQKRLSSEQPLTMQQLEVCIRKFTFIRTHNTSVLTQTYLHNINVRTHTHTRTNALNTKPVNIDK